MVAFMEVYWRASRLVLGGGHGGDVGLGKVGSADLVGALVSVSRAGETRCPSPSASAGSLVSGHL